MGAVRINPNLKEDYTPVAASVERHGTVTVGKYDCACGVFPQNHTAYIQMCRVREVRTPLDSVRVSKNMTQKQT